MPAPSTGARCTVQADPDPFGMGHRLGGEPQHSGVGFCCDGDPGAAGLGAVRGCQPRALGHSDASPMGLATIVKVNPA